MQYPTSGHPMRPIGGEHRAEQQSLLRTHGRLYFSHPPYTFINSSSFNSLTLSGKSPKTITRPGSFVTYLSFQANPLWHKNKKTEHFILICLHTPAYRVQKKTCAQAGYSNRSYWILILIRFILANSMPNAIFLYHLTCSRWCFSFLRYNFLSYVTIIIDNIRLIILEGKNIPFPFFQQLKSRLAQSILTKRSLIFP